MRTLIVRIRKGNEHAASGPWIGATQAVRKLAWHRLARSISESTESDSGPSPVASRSTWTRYFAAHEDLRTGAPATDGVLDAARDFYPSVEEGHKTLIDQHSRFLHAVMDMIKKIHRSAQMYDETESELERRIAEVDKHLRATESPAVLGEHGPLRGSSFASSSLKNALNPDGRS